jgi:putative transposase
MYARMLRERTKRFRTPLLGYSITSNHVHLLVVSTGKDRIARFMDSLEGDFAQYYNLRKKRSGAFWGGRYHATAVEERAYLWNALAYIDLNMVRAGAVRHPADWRWCGYRELIGLRRRYRLLSRDRLSEMLGEAPGGDLFRRNYAEQIATRIQTDNLNRDPVWTECMAVGSQEYVRSIESRIRNRNKMEMEVYDQAPQKAWVLKEARAQYA